MRKSISAPAWFQTLSLNPHAKILKVREWLDEDWRVKDGGFQGYDFCHSSRAAVRVIDYIMLSPRVESSERFPQISVSTTDDSIRVNESDVVVGGDSFPRLVGVAYFSPQAESHRGLCHGGSFCALMDDVIGWLGFCTSGELRPWSGYTVQVNTALRKSVKVGSILKLEAWVDRKEGGRKYWIKSKLVDEESDEIYCEGEGLFLSKAN